MKKRPASFQRALFKAFFVVTFAALTAAVPAGCGKTETDSSSDEGATFEIDFGTTGASAEELAAGSFASSLPASEFWDGLPERSGADTDLKESVLSQALYACTGWGQSTGSSLHAISAATLLLDWSNSVSAGSADPALLEDAVRSEIGRLSPVQVQTLRDNWSFIYYDADTILDSFKDVESLAEDAGCLEDARKVSENKNSRKNWRAVYDAIEDALAAP